MALLPLPSGDHRVVGVVLACVGEALLNRCVAVPREVLGIVWRDNACCAKARCGGNGKIIAASLLVNEARHERVAARCQAEAMDSKLPTIDSIGKERCRERAFFARVGDNHRFGCRHRARERSLRDRLSERAKATWREARDIDAAYPGSWTRMRDELNSGQYLCGSDVATRGKYNIWAGVAGEVPRSKTCVHLSSSRLSGEPGKLRGIAGMQYIDHLRARQHHIEGYYCTVAIGWEVDRCGGVSLIKRIGYLLGTLVREDGVEAR
mgnify:CR=1 FL=1